MQASSDIQSGKNTPDVFTIYATVETIRFLCRNQGNLTFYCLCYCRNHQVSTLGSRKSNVLNVYVTVETIMVSTLELRKPDFLLFMLLQ
jgi:hypothetical protein